MAKTSVLRINKTAKLKLSDTESDHHFGNLQKWKTSPFEFMKLFLWYFKCIGIDFAQPDKRGCFRPGLVLFQTLLWFTLLRQLACAFGTFKSMYIIRAMGYLSVLFVWTLTYRQRKRISRMLRRLEHAYLATGARNKTRHRFCAGASVLMVLVVGLVVVACTEEEIVMVTSFGVRLDDCQYAFLTPFIPDKYKVFAHTMIFLLTRLPGWSLLQMLALFYGWFCVQLSLVSKANYDSHTSTSARKSNYSLQHGLVVQLERSFSTIIFLILANFVSDVFGVIADCIFLDLRGVLTVYASRVSVYLTWIVSLCLLVVLSAELALKGLQSLRQKMVDEHESVGSLAELYEVSRLLFRLGQHEESSALTAWDVFRLNRGLVLPTLASTVTYGVILAQIHGK